MMNLLLFLFAFVSVSPGAFAAGKIVGELGMVEGEVLVDSAAVQKSSKVREGSIIEVKDGRATLLLGKGAVFHLAADSRMVINEYGINPATKVEGGELDLKFGRTRALILNRGNEKKDLKIKARAATMGVRGTEIYIDAPKDSQKPIQFFTLEGKAEVKAHPAAPPVTVNQNQGVATSGAAPAPGAATSGTGTTAPTMTVADVKNEIKNSGMSGTPSVAPTTATSRSSQPGLNDTFAVGAVPPIVLDPIQDKNTTLTITPRFCNAGAVACP